MKAILCKELGHPSTLTLEEVQSVAPNDGEVRIAIHACGVNFADILTIAGKYQVRPPLPFVPGVEVAGEVIECGAGVTHIKRGARVVAYCDHGGFAEEVSVAAARVIPIPDNMDFVAAAAFIITYGTSHVALRHRAQLQAGEVLLVTGASGGVGLTAVEIGKHLGATVIAAASSAEKLKVTAARGAEHLVDYSHENLIERVKALTDGKGADVIYDPVGGDIFDQAIRCLNWEGRFLVIGFASGRIPEARVNRFLLKSSSLMGVYWGAYAQHNPTVMQDSFAELFTWYSQGKIKPYVSQTYPLERTADALTALLERKSTGKVVVTINNP